MPKCHYCDKEGATNKVRIKAPKDYWGPPPRPKAYDIYFCNQKCKSAYEYACWKGTRGPGALLKQIVKEHNHDKRRND